MKIQPDQVVTQELAARGVDESVGVFGSHHVKIGNGSPIRLDEIKSAKVPSAGFRTATKIERGRAGIEQTATDALKTLAATGPLDAGKLLGLLKAQQTHLERLDKLGQLDPAQKQDGEGLWMFTKAIEKLSNNELSAIFQKFNSAEMDLLQTALMREGSVNPKAKDARMAAARLFNLQALVLKEVSNRTSTALLSDLRAEDANLPANERDASLAPDKLRAPERLSAEYGHSASGPEGPAAPHRHDITAANLNVLVEASSTSATKREKTAETERARLDARQLDKVSLKQMGDVLRGAELTINIDHNYFLDDTSIINNPDKPMPNFWHLHQMHIAEKGEGYNSKRDGVEKTLFPEMRHHAPVADERPVYGAINYQQNPFGAAPSYGNVVVVLKDEVKKRATYTLHDTFLAARATVTPGRRATFFKLLPGTVGIPQTLRDALLKEGTPERRALDDWFNRLAAKPGFQLARGFIRREIPAVLAAHYAESTFGKKASETGEQSLLGLLINCFGDAEATRPHMATYDNLETLIPELSDADGNALAMAALEKRDGKHPPITLEGANYIESQIQGPLIPSRDIAEIRLSLLDFPGKEDEITAKAQAFQRRTGIKVVITELDAAEVDTSPIQQKVLAFNQQHRDMPGATKAVDDILADTPKAIIDSLGHLRSEDIWRIPEPLRPALAVPGDGLSRITRELLEKVQQNLADTMTISSGPDIVRQAFTEVLAAAVKRAAPLLVEVGKLPFETEAERLAFAKFVCSNGRIERVEDVRALHAQATAQATLMRAWGAADPPPSAETVLAAFAAQPAGLDPRDVSAAVVALLRGTVPPPTPDAMKKILAVLDSESLRGITAQLDAVASGEGLRNAPGAARAAGLANSIRSAAKAVADSINAGWTPPQSCIAPLTAIQQPVRDAIRQVAPALADALDAAHPAHPPFPAPANAALLPQDKAGRKQFLVGVLEEYRQKELVKPERGRSYHGRGHIIRSFFYASAFCNILKEQGVNVDKNAVLLGISGHDLGRAGTGKDKWEPLSGQKTGQAIDARYGQDIAGEAWKNEVADSIKSFDIEPPGARKRSIPVSPTMEAQLLQSADSLDIGRLGEFDQYYFDFLRDKNGQVSPEAQKIRDQLAVEANLLQRLTNPLCANHTTIAKLTDDAMNATGELATELQRQRDDLDRQVADELIAQANNADNQAFFDDFESVIRNNPQMFPLLTRYYLNAD